MTDDVIQAIPDPRTDSLEISTKSAAVGQVAKALHLSRETAAQRLGHFVELSMGGRTGCGCEVCVVCRGLWPPGSAIDGDDFKDPDAPKGEEPTG